MKKEDVRAAFWVCLPVIIFIVFLILKLTGVIGWSWWWITASLWSVTAIIFFLAIVYLALFAYMKNKNHK